MTTFPNYPSSSSAKLRSTSLGEVGSGTSLGEVGSDFYLAYRYGRGQKSFLRPRLSFLFLDC